MPKEKIVLQHCPTYERQTVQNSIDKILELLGGIEQFIKREDKVLLKPNLLFGVKPDKLINTHYEIVRAIAIRCLDIGAKVGLGDSPAVGTVESACKACEIDKIMKELNLEYVPFAPHKDYKTPEGFTFNRLQLTSALDNWDKIINLPKLKTHGQMTLTLGVKNLFGLVVGLRKAEWHMKAGSNLDFFARMLVEIYAFRKPDLTIMDGIMSMHGNGPSMRGKPYPLRVLLGGVDCIALDSIICEIVNLPLEKLRTCIIGEQAGFGTCNREDIELLGTPIEELKVNDFEFPTTLVLPLMNLGFWQKWSTTKPVINHKLCERCGLCIKHCPPQVMKLEKYKQAKDNYDDYVKIDYSNCIRCYCCQEICPASAIDIKEGFLLRLYNLLGLP